MSLLRVSDKVWYYRYEEERDRPNLGYIKGDNWSLAVDAGHSAAHVEDFYKALEENGLPLPSLTVITHWHWDHSFGMNRVNGLTLANILTNAYIKDFKAKLEKNGKQFFLGMDPRIEKEYQNDRPVIVVPADIKYTGSTLLDAGDTHIIVMQIPSPHTDDSSLIYLPEEKILFTGDAHCGAYPTWEVDPVLANQFIAAIKRTDAELCITGHCEPLTTTELIDTVNNG